MRFLPGILMCTLAASANALAVEPASLLEVADVGSLAMSPDGSQVAFRLEQASIERNTYDAFWYVQEVGGTAPARRIADAGVLLHDSAGSAEPAVAQWSPDGRWLYYRALVDGRMEVWRAAADGAGARVLTPDDADVRAFELVDAGRGLAYSTGPSRDEVLRAEQAEYDSGVHVDASVPIGQGLVRSGNLAGRLATQRYGPVWFNRVPLLADVPDRWQRLDLATGQLGPWTPAPVAEARLPLAEPEAWLSARSSEGGIAWLTRVGQAHGLRYKPDVQLSAQLAEPGAAPVRCRATLCTGRAITGLQWRPGHAEVLFTVADPDQGGAQSLYRWQVRTGEVMAVAHGQGLLNGGQVPASPCAVSATALVCVSASATQPPRLERIDLPGGVRTVMFEPNAALAHAMAASVSVRLLRWTDAKGNIFTGQLYRPAGAEGRRTPLFVNYYHCNGFVRGGIGDEWPFASLATHGISALCINSAPYLLDPVERYDRALGAVTSAVATLQSSGEADRACVGMGGLSFGSEVTLWTAMRSRLLVAASVSSVSVSPVYYLMGSLKGEVFDSGLKELWGLGSPEQTPARWRALSPVFNLDRLALPILLQMPEQEYLQAIDYVVPLIKRSQADLYVFPNEPHIKFQPRHKLAAYARNMDWFGFWLQGLEDPDPAKAAQYRQWRAMRSAMPGAGSGCVAQAQR